MSKPLMYKLLLIAVVIVLAVVAAYPPEDRINLGLDLRGGAHILIQVEAESTVRYEMDSAQSLIGNNMTSRGLAYDAVVVVPPTTLEIRGTDPAQDAEVRDVLNNWLGWGDVRSRGAGVWQTTMPPERRSQLEVEAVDTTLDTIRRRIDGLGVSEPLVQKQGIAGDRILVQLPGVEDPQRAKDLLIATETLEWKEVKYPPTAGDNPCTSNWGPSPSEEDLAAQFGGAIPEDAQVYPQILADGTPIYWPLMKVSVVRGIDLVNARVSLDEWNTPQINFELSQDAGKRFEEATSRNVGCVMAIVLGTVENKYVFSAPSIQSAIRDTGRIMGQFGNEEAQDFALKLRSGAIPTDLTFIEERTVGPSLGRDSIKSGMTAGVAGFLGIMLFMLIYYRMAGVNAAVALLLNVLFVFGALGALPFLFSGVRATLTLPGIAGLVLTVGMAVDANVLIFERIREELRVGKTVRAAVEQGFGRAFMTILDCNVTTLVAAFFLFSYGTGPVKGFAVTLTIGLLASMFTSVFVSRQLFEVVLSSRKAETLSI